ncbi:60S ribosomal protein L15 [Batrachochytrium salamandrivorans]|nr:60S ribosomal protein L15 [Batrachochytrium salamandrivorans]
MQWITKPTHKHRELRGLTALVASTVGCASPGTAPTSSLGARDARTGRTAKPCASAATVPALCLPNFRKQVEGGPVGFCTLFTEVLAQDGLVVMTMLDEYRTMGSAATPWLSISLFDHFAASPAQTGA